MLIVRLLSDYAADTSSRRVVSEETVESEDSEPEERPRRTPAPGPGEAHVDEGDRVIEDRPTER